MTTPGGGVGKEKKSRRRRRKEDDDFYRTPPMQRPANQELLTVEELQEEFVRTLSTFDGSKTKNKLMWDFKESAFTVAVDDESSYHTLFSMPSELIDPDDIEEGIAEKLDTDLIEEISEKEEEESEEQEVGCKIETVEAVKVEASLSVVKQTSKIGSKAEPKEDDGEEPEEEKEETGGGAQAQSNGRKKLLNQFNFCDRAAQTIVHKMREHSLQTENPAKSHYRDMCNQWIIYDAYKDDAVNRPDTKEHSKDEFGLDLDHDDDHDHEPGHDDKGEKRPSDVPKPTAGKPEEPQVAEKPKVKMRKASYLSDGHQSGGGDQAIMVKAVDGLRFMERLVGSNVFEEVIEDFKYYEDGADEYRDPADLLYGTLLPLWKFTYEKAKKLHVTSISWSISQPDMFAVTFGSFNFTRPVRNGLVVIYTLRNTTYPEFAWTAPKGGMSCHVHPTRNCLVAVGLYDGNVAVLNLEKDEENRSKTEILRNVPTVLKHRAPVWSVKWGQDDIDANPIFYSVGLDGKCVEWVVGLADSRKVGGLDGTELATFHLPAAPVPGPDGTRYKLFGCGRVLAFHPKDKTTFLVGTAEGKVLKCCVHYASKFQKVYDAHYLPVAGLEWNYYHIDIFISSSEDWTIKIWDQNSLSPLYTFEVGVGILDCCWAPYSSTIFAATTDEGKILLYDLQINKERPVCSQQIVTKRKVRPHRLQFNPRYPILIVGDDKSVLQTLKLSPNLRQQPKDSRNIFYLEGDARVQFEINKLKKLLTLVRDPEAIQLGKIETDDPFEPEEVESMKEQ